MLATAQSPGSSMFGSKALMYCFVSTPKALCHSHPKVVAFLCFHVCALYLRQDSAVSGRLSCEVKTPHLKAACAPCGKTTMQLNRLVVACTEGPARSK